MTAFRRPIALVTAIVTVMIWCAAVTGAAAQSTLVVKPLPGAVRSVPADRKSASPVPAAIARPDKEKGATTANCPPLVINSANQLPGGTVQQPYLFRITTSGGMPPVTFALLKQHPLPPGLKLERSGLLTGTPQEAGEFVFAIAALDGCPQGSRSTEKRFVLTIKAATPSVMMQEAPLPQKPVEAVNGADSVMITKLSLAFENGQTRIAVSRDQKIPSVVARFELQGRGVISGYWVTPGKARIFFKQAASAPEARLSLPAGTALPSDHVGMHEIRIVLTAPNKEFPGAVARYVVRPAMPPSGDYIEGQLVVTVPLQTKARMAAELGAKFGLRLLESYALTSLSQAILVFETRGDVVALAGQVAGEADVLMAQPNQIFRTLTEPRSPLQSLSRQLNFPQLHRVSRGRGVTIAIIDTGVDIHHEDLRANIRDTRNFIPQEPYRAEIHGTAVAGIIAAALNDTGIAGLAPEARIIALRACRQVSETDPQGQGHSVSISRAIDAALESKVDIVNMSLGAGTWDRLIAALIGAGSRQGILFVAPVGNREDRSAPAFPASLETVIAVGGIKENGEVFPNRELAAAAWVCAPCDHLFTTVPGNRYNFLDGTSISAAVVSGLLALSLEKRPDLSKEDIPAGCGAIRQWTEALLGISLDE